MNQNELINKVLDLKQKEQQLADEVNSLWNSRAAEKDPRVREILTNEYNDLIKELQGVRNQIMGCNME